MNNRPLTSVIEDLLRELSPQILGAVIRRAGDFDSAEDAVQEALIDASTQWPGIGIPANARGWLYRVAVRRLHDRARSDIARHKREQIPADSTNESDTRLRAETEQDDSLVLLFMCCHPSLSPASAIALTLRAVGGLTTAEIARAFLVPEPTMAQRISRAKQSIKTAGSAFHMPAEAERADSLRSVLHVLYLMFNEGYSSSHGAALQRTDLAAEAVRITRLARTLLPNDAEVAGLLALMVLTHSRRHARTTSDGALIPLDEQDRSLWDRANIEEGRALVAVALAKGAVGPYQLQAAIAALHCDADSASGTDWPQILVLYGMLLRMTANPMVALNHAIAVAMVYGPKAAMTLVDELDVPGALAGYYRLDAVRAHFYEMAGDYVSAAVHFRRAAEKTLSIPERNYLIYKAAVASRQ
ncbi:MAG: sigma-70 family RNA polymerase sigma factor [Gemmatimonadaceae bacterium]